MKITWDEIIKGINGKVVYGQPEGAFSGVSTDSRSIKPRELLGIPDLMLRLKNAGEKVSCFKMSGLWLDLGRLDDLEIAQEVLEKNRRTILPT